MSTTSPAANETKHFRINALFVPPDEGDPKEFYSTKVRSPSNPYSLACTNHSKHMHTIRLEHSSQSVITTYLSSVVGILQVFALDIVPYFLYRLWPRQLSPGSA